ncbi:MAG: hypothetical protein R3F34_15690 [Planctomycetota bacterium]
MFVDAVLVVGGAQLDAFAVRSSSSRSTSTTTGETSESIDPPKPSAWKPRAVRHVAARDAPDDAERQGRRPGRRDVDPGRVGRKFSCT